MSSVNRTPIFLITILAACAAITVGCQSATPSTSTVPQPDTAAPDAAPEAPQSTPVDTTPAPDHVDPGDTPDEAAEHPSQGDDEEIDRATPEEVQAEALELCQSASEFLDQGSIDDAIAALDGAYELMLELPNHGQADFLQAKDDIRVLVADLLLRTYESQRTVARDPVIAWDLAIPIVDNAQVQREIKSFTNGEREAFIASYRRSGLYRPMILAKLKEAGLPSQLSWLPLVESNFKVRALSRASALGLWQFIASTGQRYGLSRDGYIDERMDPEKATDAAIGYLSDLHGIFGDWPKALAGYNCGESRVLRLSKQQPGEYQDFWDVHARLPRETRRYVPRFLASLAIIEDPAKYGMTLPEPLPPLSYTPVAVHRSMQLSALDKALGLDSGTLHGLNPELRHKSTPKQEYALKVPVEKGSAVAAAVESVPVWTPPQAQYVTHRVRRGETLSGIASRYRTSVSAIMRSNNLRSANRIWPGQRLKVPTRGAARKVQSGPSFNPVEGAHTVRRGESLYSIASRYNTTVAKLKRDNKLSSNLIRPGQKLQIRPGSRQDLSRYQVRSGDTLGAIAKKHSVSLSALLRVNGLSSRSTIYPGQWIAIPD